MNKIMEAVIPNIRKKILSSKKLCSNLRVAMCETSQEKVDAITYHFDLLLDPEELEDIVNEHAVE